jgi:hypothetical protein
MDGLLVFAIISFAAVYLLRIFYKKWKKGECECSSCNVCTACYPEDSLKNPKIYDRFKN